MEHNIAYFKMIQNALGSDSHKKTTLQQAAMQVNRDFKNSLNWESAIVDDTTQEVLITRGENATVKHIKSRPGEYIDLGALVEWAHTMWLVTRMDYDDQLHCSGVMQQCNTILKWQMPEADGYYEEYMTYGVAEDASKYGTGVSQTVYLQTAEFTIKVKVPLNEETLRIKRDQRFLFGFSGEGFHPNAYIVTRTNEVTGSYDLDEDPTVISTGYIELTMQYDEFKPGIDNEELGIADYVNSDAEREEAGKQDVSDDLPGVLGEAGWFG